MLFLLDHISEFLKKRLNEPLPGQDAQYLMAPLHRTRLEVETLSIEQYKPSAVMVLFCEDEQGDVFIPLTERMSYNGAHSAQISFPGGKFDKEDKDLMNTAIRECYEEIGVADPEVIGKLTQLYIPVSSFLVHPYVGICKIKNPVMKPQEREVKTILKLRLQDLMNDNIMHKGTIELFNNLKIQTPWFDVQGHKVWGATAMVLSELKELVKTTF
jgi:8-oxo-dGTP pyrophosphatase MutT (NUDIX family)